MKVKELMIGDILVGHYNDGEEEFDMPVVLDGIDENCTLIDGRCEFSWRPLLPKHKDVEYLEDVNPIPLTEEILSANFQQGAMSDFFRTDGMEIFFNDDNVQIIAAKRGFGRIDLYCHYVHELQHALRLCGFNELADNFKVK